MNPQSGEAAALRRPICFLVMIVFPQIVLLTGGFWVFSLVRSALEPHAFQSWREVFCTMLPLTTVTAYIGISALHTRREIAIRSYVFYAVAGSALLYRTYSLLSTLIPPALPRWIIDPEELLFIPATLLLPGILLSLFILVYRVTPAHARWWPSPLAAAAIAATWYLFFNLILPLRRGPSSQWEVHVQMVVIGVATMSFALLMIRTSLILARLRGAYWQYATSFAFGGILPLVGLYVNGTLAPMGEVSVGTLLGDFRHPAFPILAALNGVVLLIPLRSGAVSGLAMLVLRCLLFPFTLYFFLAFVPFVPLALFLVFFWGSGLLLLTPAILFLLHLRSISREYSSVSHLFCPRKLAICVSASVCLLPAIVIGSFLVDRAILDEALRFHRSPDYVAGRGTVVNRTRLKRVLHTALRYKAKSRWALGATPILDPLYKAIVFGRQTVATQAISELGEQFDLSLPATAASWAPIPPPLDTVITAVRLKQQHDGSDTESTIGLTVATSPGARGQNGFRTEFDLPAGSFVVGAALRIGEEMIQGQLAERQATEWVYRQIVSQRRDPALVYYVAAHRVRLEVFPVSPDAPREVSFTVLHRNPMTLQFGAHTVSVPATAPASPLEPRNPALLYLDNGALQRLPRVHRIPKLHFIIECGATDRGELASIHETLASHPEAPVQFIIGGTSFQIFSSREGWEDRVRRCESSGRLALPYVLRSALLRSHLESPDSYPVFYAVGRNPRLTPEQLEGLRPFLLVAPEVDGMMTNSGNRFEWQPFSDVAQSGDTPAKNAMSREVRVWPSAVKPEAFFPVESTLSAEFPLLGSSSELLAEYPSSRWSLAASMRGRYFRQLYLSGQTSDAEWSDLVRASLRSGIMIPTTAYSVLETEIQREALRRLSEERLRGRRVLDTGELQRMDEPHFTGLALLLGLAAMSRVFRVRKRELRRAG